MNLEEEAGSREVRKIKWLVNPRESVIIQTSVNLMEELTTVGLNNTLRENT